MDARDSADGECKDVSIVQTLSSITADAVITMTQLIGEAALSSMVQLGVLSRRRRSASAAIPRSSDWWTSVVPRYTDAYFQRCFRVPRAVFNVIVSRARAHALFATTPTNATRMLPADLQVAIALWRQGRAVAVRDVAQHFGVADGSVANATSRFVRFMLAEFITEITNRWPRTPERCAQLAAGMRMRVARPHGMPSCIGALDGTLVPIWCPHGLNQMFFCRKQFYAMNFQVVCDYDGYIMWTSGGRGGSVWDGNAIFEELLTSALLPALPGRYYVICDSGYSGTERLLTPYKTPRLGQLSDKQVRFNYYHSLTRGIIEKVIGILKARNRWALKGVQFAEPQAYAEHFVVACILHNMCMAHRASLTRSELAEAGPLISPDDDDDARYEGLLAPSEAHIRGYAQLKQYYEMELQKIRAFAAAATARRHGGTAGGIEINLPIPEDAVDTMADSADISDTNRGHELRQRVFHEMGMDTA